MKSFIALLTTILVTSVSSAQLQTPDLSPSATVQQTVGLTDIEINYSRPSVRERVIFGKDGLLQSGAFWRLGANEAIKFHFSNDLTIGGKSLQKGAYTMLVKPNASTWEFYVYPYESTDWNTYVLQTPLTKFSVPVLKTNKLQESFEISVQDITSETAAIELHWEFTQVMIPLKIATMETVMTSIDKTMQGPSFNDYFQAALFMHENKIDLPRALDYIQKVTVSDKALFFVVYREALILEDLQRNAEAIASAQRSLALSKTAQNDDFIRLNEQLLDRLSK